MSGREGHYEEEPDKTSPVGRYEREVEANFHQGEVLGDERLPDDEGTSIAARRRGAALSWLLFLVVIIGLFLFFWPKLSPLMHRSVAPTTPPRQEGTPTAPLQVQVARAKPPVHSYPPCTATRTDSCTQQDSK